MNSAISPLHGRVAVRCGTCGRAPDLPDEVTNWSGLIVYELIGDPGVLAYDALMDRVQCAICGRWYQMLCEKHLRKHGLTVRAYKELAGLNATTPLETSRVQALQRQHAVDQDAASWLTEYRQQNAIPHTKPEHAPRRTQYRREYLTPEARQYKSDAMRQWRNAEILEALRVRQTACGGHLRVRDLKIAASPENACPAPQMVLKRFGSWLRVRELLGQPYRVGQPKGHPILQGWNQETILAALRVLWHEHGRPLTATEMCDLRSQGVCRIGRFPSYHTVVNHFGSWARAVQLLAEETDRVHRRRCARTRSRIPGDTHEVTDHTVVALKERRPKRRHTSYSVHYLQPATWRTRMSRSRQAN